MSATKPVTSEEADAFMRRYLSRPADVTARLVFADWLEETGTSHNVAWAYYIRLKAEAERYASDGPERQELDRQADSYAPKVRANLTIPAKLFVGYPKSLLQLLPAPNFTVKLAGFVPERRVAQFMPAGIPRRFRLFPLALQEDVLLIAHDNRRAISALFANLAALLNIAVLPIHARDPDLSRALAARYPNPDPPRIHARAF